MDRQEPPAPSAVRPAWQRLHTWLGVVPLSVYLVLHLAVQSTALGGLDAYERAARYTDAWPLARVVPWFVVLLPLALHAGTGVAWLLQPRGAGAWPSGERRLLSQASGVALLAFVIGHSYQFRGRSALGLLDRGDYFSELCASLSATSFGGVPVTAVLYLAGVGAAALHCSSGLHHAGQAWALGSGLGRRWLGPACVALGVALFVLGSAIVIELATGSVLIQLSAVARDANLSSVATRPSAIEWSCSWHTVICSV